ncbi:MAG: thioredoxin [Oscillospiraceae bacterium]|nr:thioredoxin [Oscillospiraceae bacterium]
MAVLKINGSNFNEQILEKDVALVDFYADWCGPCKMVAPVVEEIADECPDITVAKANVDENADLASRYKVVSIPTLIVFKKGKESARIVGFTPKEKIFAILND